MAARPAPGNTPRAKDPRGTAVRIRAAARMLFLSKGYGATSMDAVAAAAPVSKRTLYQYYASKEDLFAAVIEEVWSAFTGAPVLSEAGEADPRAVLHAFVQSLVSHWERPEVIAFLRLIIAEAPRAPELSAAYFRSTKEPTVQALAAYLERLSRAGKLAGAPDPMLAAAQFMGAIKEPLFWPRVLGVPSAFPVEVATDRAIDALLSKARRAD
ncbi:TetR/AcrR family transcriptional regulator [Aquabacter sp. CN5-332]|uniref:TetR/AcrR family transcriptional regulator n=1 Tax=Aquabacter sp. CN5-332 TaxID=3156608 RepID=UPI0032B4CCA0